MTETLKPVARSLDEGEEIHPFGTPQKIMLTSEDTGGAFSAIVVMHEPGGGPPPHSHAEQAEYMYIMEGTYEFTLDGETRTLGPDSIVFIPPNTVHTFRNITDKPGKVLDWSLPGGQDVYFREVSELTTGKGFGDDMRRQLIDINERHATRFHDE